MKFLDYKDSIILEIIIVVKWSQYEVKIKKRLSGYVHLSQWYYDGETTERKKWKARTKDRNIVFSSTVYLSSLYHVIAMCILIKVYVVSFPNFFHWLPLPYFYIRKLLKFKIIVFCVLIVISLKIFIHWGFQDWLWSYYIECHNTLPKNLLLFEGSNQSFIIF